MTVTTKIKQTVQELGRTAAYYKKLAKGTTVYDPQWKIYFTGFQSYRDAAKLVAKQLLHR